MNITLIKQTLKFAGRRETAVAHYGEVARIGKVLASPTRLRLLDLLRQAPRSVETIAELAGLSVANASQHLKEMRSAGLVTTTRRGHFVEYRLASEQVSRLFCAVRDLAEALLPEMDRVRAELGMLPEAERDEILRRIRRREVTLLDVRPAREFEAGHVAGAQSVPLEELRRRIGEIPRNREVVACCRGPYCTLAAEAVELLRKAGYRARHLDLGPPDLRERGFLLEVVEPDTQEGNR